MAAVDYANVVQQLYVSYFGRPADYYGLQNFEAQLNAIGAPTTIAGVTAAVQAGTNVALVKLVNSFNAAPESVALYGAGTTQIEISKFVAAIYTNVLGRPADVAGANWWIAEIVAGRLTKANAALAISAGALVNTTPQGVIDAATITAKVAVANDFTTSVDTITEINAYSGDAAAAAARAMLATVTNTTTVAAFHATVDATIAGVASGAVAGQTFTLTTGVDVLTGTAGNDTFIGDYSVNNISTINASDKIDGGAGFDSLRLFNAGGTAASTVALPQLSGVENITLVNPTATTGITLNIANAVGVTEVSLEGAAAAAVNFTGLTSATNVLVKGVNGSQAINAVVGTTDTSGKLTLSGSVAAGTVDFTGAAVTTLNVTSTGASANKVAGLTVTTGKLSTLNVSGDKALTITGALTANTTTIDSSASTGGLTATFTGATHGTASPTKITGGAGVENITLGTGGGAKFTIDLGAGNDRLALTSLAVDAASTFSGGDGNDTLALTDLGAALTATTGKMFTNFETLEVSAVSATAQTYDPTLIAGITSYKIAASTGDLTLKNLVANANVTVIGDVASTSGVKLNLKDSSGTSDSLTLTFDNGKTAATATATEAGVTVTKLVTMVDASNGIETLNLVSNGKVGATAATLNNVTLDAADTVLKAINISGDQAFSITTGAIGANLTKIDGSTATGKLTIVASGDTAGVLNINGGSASDTITGAKLGGAIYGGGAGDTIDLTAGAGKVDTLVYKAASDSLFALKADGTLDTAKIDVVTKFVTTEDKLDFTSLTFTANTDKFVVQKSVADLKALVVLAAAADFYNDASAIARGVVAVTVGTDVYVFADANHDHKFDATTDLVIKLGAASAVTADVIFG